MKIVSSFFMLASFSLSAASPEDVKKLSDFLDQKVPVVDCGIETKNPFIKKGEVKIAYDCADFPLPEKTEQETISFYLDEAHSSNGLILRSRVNKADPTQRDVTVKFRPKDNEKISLEKLMYDSLKTKSDENKDALELKCEADVALGPKVVNSCSLTTTTADLTDDHQAFAQMTTSTTLKAHLSDYPSVSIEAQSWKIESPSFKKGISLERWEIKNQKGETLCLMEASAKFEVDKDPEEDLPQRLETEANAALTKLAKAFPDKTPLPEQGNKTGRALDFAASTKSRSSHKHK